LKTFHKRQEQSLLESELPTVIGMYCALMLVILMVVQTADAGSATKYIQDSGVNGGLVVVVGCDDPELIADLRAGESYLIHGLDTNPDTVDKAREVLTHTQAYGKISVDVWDGRRLPYVNNSVNLLISPNSELRQLRTEIRRVLAPRGVAFVGGEKMVQPIPSNIDDWPHHMYDSTGIGAGKDTAVSRPRSIQWKAGPEYGRSHENMSSVSAVVVAGGRIFSIMDEGPTESLYLPARWFLSARDAFSGVLLWKIPIEQWHATLFPLKSGPQQLPRRLVASGDRVYVTLGLDAPVSQIHAGTGEVMTTYKDTAHAEELLYLDGKLIVVTNSGKVTKAFQGKLPKSRHGFVLSQETISLDDDRSIVLVDTDSGETVWTTEPSPVVPLTTAAGGQRIYAMVGGLLRCIDVADGRPLWDQQVTTKTPRFGTSNSPTLLVYRHTVYVAAGGTLSAFDTEKGDRLWEAPCARAGYRAPASIFIIDDLIWDIDVGGEPYRPGTDPTTVNRYFTGYDLRSGEVRKKIPTTSRHGYAIMHHRCHVPRASGNHIITSFPGIEFFDVTTGRSTHDSWIRGACLYGFVPANGLIYTPPHPCACYTQGKLTGFWATAGSDRISSIAVEEASGPRMKKGAAFSNISQQRPEASPDDWPTYRRDAARSGRTSTVVPTQFSQAWKTDLGPGITPPVIADGRVFIVHVDRHTVCALDSSTGDSAWSFTAGGRVDSPPTIHNGLAIFGSRDGYVYCLRASDGEPVWKFRAAPADVRCVARDQVESVWPVHGSVLVTDDVLWFCAGRSSYLDGGLRVYRLDPLTAECLSITEVDSLGPDDQQPPIKSTIFARLDMEGAKNDVLSCDGNHVFMRHWAFDLQGKSVGQDINHLFSPTGFLDTSWFRRTYWLYGNVYVSGAQGWARAGNVRPSGRIMSLDDDHIYGFGRDKYPPSPGNAHQMYLQGEREMLFATARTSGDIVAEDAPKGKAVSLGPDSYKWMMPADIQVRAMVLAGVGTEKRLIVAGAKGDWVTSQQALEGKLGSILRMISPEDGSTIREIVLPGLPVFDGMAVAHGKVFLSMADGAVVCFQ